MVMNRSLQEVNIQNMNVELVAQMFKNYQSNVLFHLEGLLPSDTAHSVTNISSDGHPEGSCLIRLCIELNEPTTLRWKRSDEVTNLMQTSGTRFLVSWESPGSWYHILSAGRPEIQSPSPFVIR